MCKIIALQEIIIRFWCMLLPTLMEAKSTWHCLSSCASEQWSSRGRVPVAAGFQPGAEGSARTDTTHSLPIQRLSLASLAQEAERSLVVPSEAAWASWLRRVVSPSWQTTCRQSAVKRVLCLEVMDLVDSWPAWTMVASSSKTNKPWQELALVDITGWPSLLLMWQEWIPVH